jgi:hypothetical protein
MARFNALVIAFCCFASSQVYAQQPSTGALLGANLASNLACAALPVVGVGPPLHAYEIVELPGGGGSREIRVVFDTTGAPMMLGIIGPAASGLANHVDAVIINFDGEPGGVLLSNVVEDPAVDSVGSRGSAPVRTVLDSSSVEIGRSFARALWVRRCVED